jgi:hypothetical protein
MSDIRVAAKTSGIGRAGQGTYAGAAGTLEGGLITADLSYLLSLNGDVFVANGGSASSPATFAGAYDADGPDFVIDVPDGTTIVPLAINIHYQTVGTTGLLETFASVSGTLGAVSAGTAVTPQNIRTGAAGSSGCTVNVAVDAAGSTAQTGAYEFFRGGFQLVEDMAATEDWAERTWNWSARESGVYPIIDGAGSLFIHCAAVAGTGFITVTYYEVSTNTI